MSVSAEQKKEIIEYTYKSSCCRRALLCGMLFAKGAYDGKRVTLSLEKVEYAEFLSNLIQEFYGKTAEIYRSSKGGRNIYISFDSPSASKYISKIESIEDAEIVDIAPLKCRSCIASFLRGVFLASGRLSDPEKQFALEFSLGRKTESFAKILTDLGMTPRISHKKSGDILYFRRCDDIESFYGHAGLNKIVFSVIEKKIASLARRESQRYLNWVTKNYDRMTVAAERVLIIIKKLDELQLLSSLPEELEETARLRLEYPELSISALASKSNPTISKSGMSHRLKKIEELGREMLEMTER